MLQLECGMGFSFLFLSDWCSLCLMYLDRYLLKYGEFSMNILKIFFNVSGMEFYAYNLAFSQCPNILCIPLGIFISLSLV